MHEVAPFGRVYGHSEEYGHIDLVAGRSADRETFPKMLAWLQAQPAQRRADK